MASYNQQMINDSVYRSPNSPCSKCGKAIYSKDTDKCIKCYPTDKKYQWLDGDAELRKKIEDKEEELQQKRDEDPYNFGD